MPPTTPHSFTVVVVASDYEVSMCAIGPGSKIVIAGDKIKEKKAGEALHYDCLDGIDRVWRNLGLICRNSLEISKKDGNMSCLCSLCGFCSSVGSVSH